MVWYTVTRINFQQPELTYETLTTEFFQNSSWAVKFCKCPNLPNISANHSQTEKTKCMDPKWLPMYISIILVVDCLTSVIWPFTLTAFTWCSWLYCAEASHSRMGEQWILLFHKGIIGSQTWMPQLEHNTSLSQQWRLLRWMVRLLKLSNQVQG